LRGHPYMVPERLDNYLRAQRKQSGLTQTEIAFLLGESTAHVSRYEKRHNLPPLETAIACEVVFGVPVDELFAGLRQRLSKVVERRRSELRTKLEGRTYAGSAALRNAHKLRWLGSAGSDISPS
jgi:transcriptional regulator with XRE-family HTH domain